MSRKSLSGSNKTVSVSGFPIFSWVLKYSLLSIVLNNNGMIPRVIVVRFKTISDSG